MLVSLLFSNKEVLEHRENLGDVRVPCVMLVSPSMRCNYRCEDCYAGSYERKDDMKPEVFDRLLTDAENMGIDFFVILGGEPFIYPELLDIVAKHNRSFFQIYTSGFFIDQPRTWIRCSTISLRRRRVSQAWMVVVRPSITQRSPFRGGPGHWASAISTLEIATCRSPWMMPPISCTGS